MSKFGLNVGSGQRPFTSTTEVRWINIDKVARTEQPLDLQCDGTSLPAFYDANVDYLVLHHVLEHLWQMDAKNLITEAYRVLKPGGSLLVFVPNMRALAIRWLEGHMDTQLYMTNVYGAYMGDEADIHRWGYEQWSLAGFLAETPWVAVKTFDWRVIPGADLARDWWVLAMECVK